MEENSSTNVSTRAPLLRSLSMNTMISMLEKEQQKAAAVVQVEAHVRSNNNKKRTRKKRNHSNKKKKATTKTRRKGAQSQHTSNEKAKNDRKDARRSRREKRRLEREQKLQEWAKSKEFSSSDDASTLGEPKKSSIEDNDSSSNIIIDSNTNTTTTTTTTIADVVDGTIHGKEDVGSSPLQSKNKSSIQKAQKTQMEDNKKIANNRRNKRMVGRSSLTTSTPVTNRNRWQQSLRTTLEASRRMYDGTTDKGLHQERRQMALKSSMGRAGLVVSVSLAKYGDVSESFIKRRKGKEKINFDDDEDDMLFNTEGLSVSAVVDPSKGRAVLLRSMSDNNLPVFREMLASAVSDETQTDIQEIESEEKIRKSEEEEEDVPKKLLKSEKEEGSSKDSKHGGDDSSGSSSNNLFTRKERLINILTSKGRNTNATDMHSSSDYDEHMSSCIDGIEHVIENWVIKARMMLLFHQRKQATSSTSDTGNLCMFVEEDYKKEALRYYQRCLASIGHVQFFSYEEISIAKISIYLELLAVLDPIMEADKLLQMIQHILTLNPNHERALQELNLALESFTQVYIAPKMYLSLVQRLSLLPLLNDDINEKVFRVFLNNVGSFIGNKGDDAVKAKLGIIAWIQRYASEFRASLRDDQKAAEEKCEPLLNLLMRYQTEDNNTEVKHAAKLAIEAVGDFTLEVIEEDPMEGEEPERIVLQVFAARLMEKSEYFKLMLGSGMVEQKNRHITIYTPHPQQFLEMVDYFYTGSITITDVDQALAILLCANQYSVPSIRDSAVEFLQTRSAKAVIYPTSPNMDDKQLSRLRVLYDVSEGLNLGDIMTNISDTMTDMLLDAPSTSRSTETIKALNVIVSTFPEVMEFISAPVIVRSLLQMVNKVDILLANFYADMLIETLRVTAACGNEYSSSYGEKGSSKSHEWLHGWSPTCVGDSKTSSYGDVVEEGKHTYIRTVGAMEERRCSACLVFKAIEQFSRRQWKKGGHGKGRCSECIGRGRASPRGVHDSTTTGDSSMVSDYEDAGGGHRRCIHCGIVEGHMTTCHLFSSFTSLVARPYIPPAPTFSPTLPSSPLARKTYNPFATGKTKKKRHTSKTADLMAALVRKTVISEVWEDLLWRLLRQGIIVTVDMVLVAIQVKRVDLALRFWDLLFPSSSSHTECGSSASASTTTPPPLPAREDKKEEEEEEKGKKEKKDRKGKGKEPISEEQEEKEEKEGNEDEGEGEKEDNFIFNTNITIPSGFVINLITANAPIKFMQRALGDIAAAGELNKGNPVMHVITNTTITSRSYIVNLLELLLKSGADPNVMTGVFSPLMEIVRRNDVELLDLVLSTSTVPVLVNQGGAPAPLSTASPLLYDPSESISKSARNTEVTAMYMACSAVSPRMDIIERLFTAGANVEPTGPSKDNPQMNTPLMAACFGGQVDLVRWLLDAGADINRENAVWWRPLHFAAHNGDEELVKLLLKYNAKNCAAQVYSRGARDAPAEVIANKRGHSDAVQSLLKDATFEGPKVPEVVTPTHLAPGEVWYNPDFYTGTSSGLRKKDKKRWWFW